MAKRKGTSQAFIRFLFLVYCAVMLWLLFGRPTGWIEGQSYEQMLRMNLNLQPLYTIRNYVSVIRKNTDPELVRHCIINLGGNILLFIPAGYLLPRIFQKQRNFLLFFITCAASILLIETAQLFSLLGSFDIDDLILNLVGMILGFSIYCIRHPKH